jgi:translation initiation factor 5A
VDIPIIDKRTAQVIAIMGGDVQLMDLETYETFETPIPDELSEQLVEGVEVEYIEALGQRKLMRTKG